MGEKTFYGLNGNGLSDDFPYSYDLLFILVF